MPEKAFTITRNEIDCPRPSCLAKQSDGCRQPSGRRTQYPHAERVAQMTPAQWARCGGGPAATITLFALENAVMFGEKHQGEYPAVLEEPGP